MRFTSVVEKTSPRQLTSRLPMPFSDKNYNKTLTFCFSCLHVSKRK
ncbi:Uncharacterized protein APZ42_020731 [Daphnia magna]|uniref:Uncharacterized protein n=1 Tax=Daphnia magna TaxID=35525 RepID=A0A162CL72_9CRUS|nr:Uncharacterized protein APZ42_020731 [Daphnia magna]